MSRLEQQGLFCSVDAEVGLPLPNWWLSEQGEKGEAGTDWWVTVDGAPKDVLDAIEPAEALDNHEGENEEMKKLLSGMSTKIAQLESTIKSLHGLLQAEQKQREDLEKLVKDEIKKQPQPNHNQSKIGGPDPQGKVLPQDSFSFMLVSPTKSTPFTFSIFIFAVQMAIFALVSSDLVEDEKYNNVFGIPADGSLDLRIAQFIAILVAVLTQGDLMTGFEAMRDGYQESFSQLFHGASQWKHWLSLLTRLLGGCVGLVVSFLLIVTAETVVDLLLNFTAIEFVSKMDEVLFFLSRKGFMGKTCKKEAFLVQNTHYSVTNRYARGLKAVMLVVILLAMLAGWGVVLRNQATGDYYCKTIRVRFGDVPALGTNRTDEYSGSYDFVGRPSFSRQWASYEKRRSLDGGSLETGFFYCQNAWIFYEGPRGSREYDPCDKWIAKSAKMDTADLLDTAHLTWEVRGSSTQFHFTELSCSDQGR